jgi:RNA polymerase sigma-70 factor, ECF subfamily
MNKQHTAGWRRGTMNFEQIVSKYEPVLIRYARSIVRNHEDAEEIVQDAFLRAHRAMISASRSQPRSGALKGWLFTITLNVARNRLRRKRLASISLQSGEGLEAVASLAASAPLPDSIYETWADIDRVKHAISQLPIHLRGAAQLHFLSGKTNREIAEFFSRPLGTVKSQVHRAARIVRQRLAA